MRFWALQYGPYVEVLEPKEIREKLSEDIKAMAEKYK
jgi:predicted DNA-binding transcriptional regulator YafY